MIKVIPNRTFLLKQTDLDGGKKKDVLAKKGERIEVSEREAVKFWSAFDLTDEQKKKLLPLAKQNGWTRVL
jgi:hypothetical protein